MAMFLLSPISEPVLLTKKVEEMFPGDVYRVPSSKNLMIYFQGTAKELSDKLGVTTGDPGTGVIVTVANYYGRAPTDLWEWMKIRMERD